MSFPYWIAYLQQHYPAAADSFNPPATDADLDALEALIGTPLPPEVRALYRLADGQDGTRLPVFVEGLYWMPLEQIRAVWTLMKELHAEEGVAWTYEGATNGVQHCWWDPLWIPFADQGTGDHYCIDLAPAPGGTVGQVIHFIHDDTPRPLLARSLMHFVHDHLDALRTGRYAYHEAWDAFVAADEA